MKQNLHKFGPIAALVVGLFLLLHVGWRFLETSLVLAQTGGVYWTVRNWEKTTATLTTGAPPKPGAPMASGPTPSASGQPAAPPTAMMKSGASGPPIAAPSTAGMPGAQGIAAAPGMAGPVPPGNPPGPRRSGPGGPGPGGPPGPTPTPGKYDGIAKSGIFGGPPPPPPPHVLTGVIGKKAIVDGQLVGVGEMAGDSKVVEIGLKKAVLEKDGQRTELQVFQ